MAAWGLSIPAGKGLFSSNQNNLTTFGRFETCHIADESHTLKESDLLGEADDLQGIDVYVLLNLDGSLPFPGWNENIVLN